MSDTNTKFGPLRQKLVKHFSLEELQAVAFDLSINFDQLEGKTLDTKSIALIRKLDNRGRLNELIDYCQDQRSTSDWKEVYPYTSQSALQTDAFQARIVSHEDTDWVGFLLDYSLKYSDRETFDYIAIEKICEDCVESFDLFPLQLGLTHSEKSVRKFSAMALGEIGNRFQVNQHSIVLSLITTINATDLDLETKRRTVWALGSIRPNARVDRTKARKTLRKLLVNKREDTSVRWRAAWALGELQAKEEASLLAHFAKNPKEEINIRRAAIRSLGAIKAVQFRKDLLDIAKENGTKLEQTAFWCLNEINSSPG